MTITHAISTRFSSIKAQESRQTASLGMPAIPGLPQSPQLSQLSQLQQTQQPQLSQFPQSAVAIDMIETQLLPPRDQIDVFVSLPTPGTTSGRLVDFASRDTGEHRQVTGPIVQVAGMGNSEEMGVNSIFRSLPFASHATTLSRLDRRDRVVLLLLNGKRTLRDVSLLVRRSEMETARAIVRLLKLGYVEYIGEK